MKGYCKAHGIATRKGFYAYSNKFGKPAQRTWQDILRYNNKKVISSYPNPTTLNIVKPFDVKLMERVEAELGTKEWPPYSNWGAVEKYLKAVGISFPAPYCAAFVTYCVKRAGWGGSLPKTPGWVPAWESWAKAKGYIRKSKLGATKGNIVTFDWDGDARGNHIGVILKNYGPMKLVATIEGNATSSKLPGGGVVKKMRPWSQVNKVIRLPRW
jgi:hypothetical protein